MWGIFVTQQNWGQVSEPVTWLQGNNSVSNSVIWSCYLRLTTLELFPNSESTLVLLISVISATEQYWLYTFLPWLSLQQNLMSTNQLLRTLYPLRLTSACIYWWYICCWSWVIQSWVTQRSILRMHYQGTLSCVWMSWTILTQTHHKGNYRYPHWHKTWNRHHTWVHGNIHLLNCNDSHRLGDLLYHSFSLRHLHESPPHTRFCVLPLVSHTFWIS